jgi:hypothetical protein
MEGRFYPRAITRTGNGGASQGILRRIRLTTHRFHPKNDQSEDICGGFRHAVDTAKSFYDGNDRHLQPPNGRQIVTNK